MYRLRYILNISIVALMFAAIAIGRDGRIVGEQVEALVAESSGANLNVGDTPVETTLAEDITILDSTVPGAKISGFAGATPVRIYVRGGVIERLELGANSETESFIEMMVESDFFEQWNGMSVEEAATAKVDMVTGATYSSDAIIKNVRAVTQQVSNVGEVRKSMFSGAFTLKNIVGLIVIALGVAITLARPKSNKFIIGQWVLNVAVLGFWCGSFLSLSHFTSFAANGFNFSIALLPIALLLVVIVMPLLGRKGSYCHVHCPMGSAQDLLNKVPLKRVKIDASITKILSKVRYYILFALMFLMWCGVGFSLMDYEVFSAFLVGSASTFVLSMAALFLVLSLFVAKPYCRFVCPTGALLTISQKTDE